MSVLSLCVSSPGKTHEAGHSDEAEGRDQLTISWREERGGVESVLGEGAYIRVHHVLQ